MTRSASAMPWPVLLKVLAVPTILLVWQYLAGLLFLASFRVDPRHASPLTMARYALYYGQQARVRRHLIGAAVVSIATVAVAGWAIATPKPQSLHGEARFATRREMARAGLFAKNGIILGQWRGLWRRRLIVLSGQTGVSLAAEPGAGKNVAVVTPNLFEWQGSAVCTDPKLENYTLTAGYRHDVLHQAVFLFHPLSSHTHRWNPLDYVASDSHQRISDLQLIAYFFFPDPPNTDPFWAAGGRALFLGIALYLFETLNTTRTIGEILRQGMANHQAGFAEHWKRVIQDRQRSPDPLSDTCVRTLSDLIDLAPQTASSIRRTFTSRLELWMNPVLDAATSASDFDLRKLRQLPMSIYAGVQPKDLDRLSPLMSLFFQQVVALQTDTLPEHDPTLTVPLLAVLDEFPAFGRIPIIAKSSGFLRAYGVRLLVIMQSTSQIRDHYGDNGAKTLLKTMGAKICFGPTDMEDASALSNELGYVTVKAKSTSASKPTLSLGGASAKRPAGTVSTTDQRRALMLPQELKDLRPDRQIILAKHIRPILCNKICYYTMPRFARRVRPPPSVPQAPQAPPVSPSTPPANETVAPPSMSTAADLDNIDSLTLEDFAADFSQVAIPEKAPGERMTAAEMDAAVAGFLNTLREG
jgi:type IV secretion system protein VirD4